MKNLATKFDNKYYNNLLKTYNKEELALMHTHSNMREYGYKKVQDKLISQNKRLEKALKSNLKSVETIIRVDKLTNEMDSAITQEIFYIRDRAKEALGEE